MTLTLGLILLSSSFCLCLLLTPGFRRFCSWIGLVDRPDKRRKIHDHAIPVAGGITILLAGATVLGMALLVDDSFRDRMMQYGSQLLCLFLGCVIICIVGVIDDVYTLRGFHKLLGQVLAVGIVMSSGFVVRNLRFFGSDLELGPLAVPFTALWILGGINSLNLLDGMDGLLGIVALISCGAIGCIALLQAQAFPAAVALVLVGSLFGFLVYNFPPATIFLGDGGSMLIGLLVAVLSIQATAGPVPAIWNPAYALAVLTIPMCDTLAAIVRRKLAGRSVFCSDRGHLHHCLLRRGLLPRRTLLVVAGLSLMGAAGALTSLYYQVEWLAYLTLPILAGLLIETRLFGHAEFILVKKQLRAMAVRMLLGKLKGKVHQMEVRLQGYMPWEELWEKLILCAADLDLVSICLDVNAPALHEGYYAFWESFGHYVEYGGGWQAEIPLEAWGPFVGRVVLRGQPNDGEFWHKIGSVARVIDEFQTPALPRAQSPLVDNRPEVNRQEAVELATATK